MDGDRRYQIQQWGALIRTLVWRESLGWCRSGRRGGRVDGLVFLGIQLYTTIIYTIFGENEFTG